ncbi:MAG TPA: hypothetical protein VGJ26_06780 [Pirellulales bacterium]|jgi:hypothetical protein
MKWFVEDPTPTLVLAALTIGVLIIALVRTGRGGLLYAIAGVGILTVAILALEWAVVTDKEEVEYSLSGACHELEANNVPGVLSYIDPKSPAYGRLKNELGRVRVSKASYNRLDVEVDRSKNPIEAKANFMGYIQAKDTRGEIPFQTFAQHFTVTLRFEGNRWMLTDYKIVGFPEGSY